MKIIGTIPAKFTDAGEIENTDYLDGSVVMLSRAEVVMIDRLQEACSGDVFNWRNAHGDFDDIEMSNIFRLVYEFANAKFAVNEFREAIDRLDDLLMKENEE